MAVYVIIRETNITAGMAVQPGLERAISCQRIVTEVAEEIEKLCEGEIENCQVSQLVRDIIVRANKSHGEEVQNVGQEVVIGTGTDMEEGELVEEHDEGQEEVSHKRMKREHNYLGREWGCGRTTA